MKANEIRISNLIQWEDESEEIISIKSIIHDSADEYLVKFAGGSAQLAEFKPIPLTEEWLLKFGFEIEKDPRVDHWHFGINPYTQDWMILIKSLGAGFFYQNGYFRIPYVHSLQNLYFALTGEELELKY